MIFKNKNKKFKNNQFNSKFILSIIKKKKKNLVDISGFPCRHKWVSLLPQ